MMEAIAIRLCRECMGEALVHKRRLANFINTSNSNSRTYDRRDETRSGTVLDQAITCKPCKYLGRYTIRTKGLEDPVKIAWWNLNGIGCREFAALRRAADWKLPKVEWNQCPDPLLGRDRWSHPTLLSSGIFHPAARLRRLVA